MFLPPSTMALIQPMDQGVLEALEKRYRRSMLQKLLLQDQEGQSVIEGIKLSNMKDVVYTSAEAWNDIPAVTLTRSWNKPLASDKTASSDKEQNHADCQEQSVQSLAKELHHRHTDQDITMWINQASSDPGYQLSTNEKLIQQTVGPSTEEETDMEDDEDQDEPNTTISSSQAADVLDQCLAWYERQEEATASLLLLLQRIRDLAASKRYENLKQLTLSSFFQSSHSTSWLYTQCYVMLTSCTMYNIGNVMYALLCAFVERCNHDVMLLFHIYEHFTYINRGRSQGVRISKGPLYLIEKQAGQLPVLASTAACNTDLIFLCDMISKRLFLSRVQSLPNHGEEHFITTKRDTCPCSSPLSSSRRVGSS